MVRSVFCVAILLAALGAASSTSAAPDERVPRVTNDMLPVVGTCAPIERENVTHVMCGLVGWYRVKGVADPVDAEGLVEILKARAGTERPSPHGVWFQASRDHVWGHIAKARLICDLAGIYRVGVRVRHESDGQIYGFPLFLPAEAEPEGPKVGTASRLPLVVDMVQVRGAGSRGGGWDWDASVSSAPRVLWKAAVTAREKYDQDVVAEIRIANNVNLQYALEVLDMLHRAGCAAVRVKTVTMVSRIKDANAAQIRIVRIPRFPRDSVLPATPVNPITVPDVPPRDLPWPLHGANRPGALYLELEELPVPGEERPATARDPSAPLPNYLRRGTMGESARMAAATRIVEWARALGPAIRAGLKSSAAVEKQMVVRLRPPGKLSPVIAPVADAFPDADDIRVSMIRFDALLFREGQPVGIVDVTLRLSDAGVAFVFARRGPADLPVARNLPPEPVDRYAAGVPGAFRVWLEGAILDALPDSSAGIPLCPIEHVLVDLPQVMHQQLSDADADRASETRALVSYLRALRVERLILTVREASATVRGGGEILGVVRFGLEAEEKELRVNALEPHRTR